MNTQSVMNTVQNRRMDWRGAVVHDPMTGQYWRITSRDVNTGWCTFEYVGPQAPPGPVYRWEPNTWDLKAYAASVPPWQAFVVAVGGFLFFTIGGAMTGDDAFAGLAILMGIAFAAVTIFVGWQMNIEPVRGTRISAAITAAAAVRHHQNSAYLDQHTMQVPQWGQGESLMSEGQRHLEEQRARMGQ